MIVALKNLFFTLSSGFRNPTFCVHAINEYTYSWPTVNAEIYRNLT